MECTYICGMDENGKCTYFYGTEGVFYWLTLSIDMIFSNNTDNKKSFRLKLTCQALWKEMNDQLLVSARNCQIIG